MHLIKFVLYSSKEEMLEVRKNEKKKAQKEVDEAEIRRLTIKNLIWSNRKNIIWTVVTIGPLLILGIIKLIELIIKLLANS